ncbi:MAG: sigma 54-interacting transcriptional regulator [Desulfobacca sp.]|uniref:sigma 54-interacting transcriptional regulator n=1 Tax=Desulfobacca sp. TaxID=2067990 RepID=UPI00404B94DD
MTHKVNGGSPAPWLTLKKPILTQDPRFQKLLTLIPLYARTDLPVLITGEPGTGKELVAEAIWALSPQQAGGLIKLNCAALVESVANSELFGHVRGAFTDAHRCKKGKFALAHQGTLFLDEIGDLPLAVQPRLLRAVELGEIEPLGSETVLNVQVRLIATTNQDLRQLIAQGRFRRDLYDRLSTLLLHLPPLRERPADILFLASYFATQTAYEYSLGPVYLSGAVEKKLLAYSWPGNVRELKNVITRAVLLREDVAVEEIYLEGDESSTALARGRENDAIATLPTRPPEAELRELLRLEQGNITAISRRLGVCTKTIYRWLKHYKIEPEQFRQVSGL